MNQTKKTMKRGGILIAVLISLAIILTACGSGGGGSSSAFSGGTSGTGVVVEGTMTKGSVIVNGIAFTVASGAAIRIDDNPVTEGDLDDGMVVKIRGTRNDDGITGTAGAIETENEVQGIVENLNAAGSPPSFTILEQLVYTDDQTVFANFPGPDPDDILDLQNNIDFVEVHGQRDINGSIRATRVELISPRGAELDEVKGVVRNKGANGAGTFEIGMAPNQIIIDTLTDPAVFEPATESFATLIDGVTVVEVKGDGVSVPGILIAAVVQVEDIEDAEFEPGEGQEVEVEGFINGFTSHPGTFKVGDDDVQTIATTRFEGGSDEDITNNIKVEAEGQIIGGILIADKIKFKRVRVRIEAEAADASTLSLATGDNITVDINNVTEDPDGILPMTATNRYEMRGFKDAIGNVVAEEIKSAGGGTRDILQSAVENIAGDILTIIGLSIDIGTVTEFRDANDQIISGGKAAFLSSVSVGTVVKVRDNNLDGNWDLAELEN